MYVSNCTLGKQESTNYNQVAPSYKIFFNINNKVFELRFKKTNSLFPFTGDSIPEASNLC